MKRKAPKQPAQRTPKLPRSTAPDAPAQALDDAPEQPGIEQARQHAPSDAEDAARTSIEHADERRPGSIETVPAPEDPIASFVEPAGDDRADEALPPPLRAP
jgi:hypothetical protein